MFERFLKWAISDPLGDTTRVLAIVWGMILLGLLSLLLPAWAEAQTTSWSNGIKLIGAGLFLAGSSTVVGSLIGFLFGVPRSRTVDSRTKGESELRGIDSASGEPVRTTSGRGTEPNTNLEQVSDWLTKIIVGVGLTHFPAIADFFRDIGTKWRDAFGGSSAGEIIAISVCVHYLLMGFFQGFLLSSLWLPGAMQRSRQQPDQSRSARE